MKRSILLTVACGVVALTIGTSSLSAQLVNLPVYYSPNQGPGLAINADYARGFEDNQDVNFFGGRAVLGLGVANVMAGAGILSFGGDGVVDVDNEMTLGGAVSLNLFQGPLVPVAVGLQTGLGYTKFGEGVTAITQIDVPIGVGLSLSVPSPGVSVEPWAAPRLHYRSISPDVGDGASELGYGVSAGLNITLPGGFGGHVAADYLKIDTPVAGVSLNEFTLGVGLHYRIGVPGIVPGGIIK